jgi:small GTP-binding protein
MSLNISLHENQTKMTTSIPGNQNDAIKIVIIGDSGVGKTNFVYYFVHGKKMIDKGPTVGASFTAKTIDIKDPENPSKKKNTMLYLWDTAGQERFRSLVALYYRNASACFCLFALDNKESFKNAKKWIQEYMEYNPQPSIVYLIANKTDIGTENWEVTEEEIYKLANDLKIKFYYTNCINSTNILDIFHGLIADIILLKEQTKKQMEDRYTISKYFYNLGSIIKC